MTRLFRRLLQGAALALTLLVLVAAISPQGSSAVRTALFLPQVLPTIPFKPQEWVTQAPTRQEVRYPTATGTGLADLYVPGGGGRHPAVLLFLGVNPAGRDDPRVVGLAEALARSGSVVMIPWSETMTQRRIAVEEIDNLVHAFQYMRSLDVVDAGKAGMGGFCVGASLATVAAEDLRINQQVRFVNFFGGYYDAVDLLKAVVAGRRFYSGESEPWEPDSLSVEVVRTHLIESLDDPDERAQLSQAVLNADAMQVSASQLDLERLSPQARAVYRLLTRPELSEVDGLIAEMPEDFLESLRRISPSTNIDNLRARMLIMHDREDSLVPSEESRRLVEALGPRQDAYYTEFSFFQHVDPTEPVGFVVFVREAGKFFLHMYNVLRELS